MIWLRSFLFFLSLILFTPPYAVFCLLSLPYAVFCLLSFPFINEHKRYQLIQFWGKSIIHFLEFFCGIRYQVLGMEHVHAVQDQPIVILSKHQSAWDVPQRSLLCL
ncbi:MAG: 1-acyl-sn-glycerol-3-phosphate acyltransferase [Pseudomonadota bacterium]